MICESLAGEGPFGFQPETVSKADEYSFHIITCQRKKSFNSARQALTARKLFKVLVLSARCILQG